MIGSKHSRALPAGDLQDVGTDNLTDAEAARKVAVFVRAASLEARSAAAPQRQARLVALHAALVARGVPATMGPNAVEVAGHDPVRLEGKEAPAVGASRFIERTTEEASRKIYERARPLFDREELKFVLRRGSIEIRRRDAVVARLDRFRAVAEDGSFSAHGDVLADESILLGLSQAVGAMVVPAENEPESRRRPSSGDIDKAIELFARHGIIARRAQHETAVDTAHGEMLFTSGTTPVGITVRAFLKPVAGKSQDAVRELAMRRFGHVADVTVDTKKGSVRVRHRGVVVARMNRFFVSVPAAGINDRPVDLLADSRPLDDVTAALARRTLESTKPPVPIKASSSRPTPVPRSSVEDHEVWLRMPSETPAAAVAAAHAASEKLRTDRRLELAVTGGGDSCNTSAAFSESLPGVIRTYYI